MVKRGLLTIIVIRALLSEKAWARGLIAGKLETIWPGGGQTATYHLGHRGGMMRIVPVAEIKARFSAYLKGGEEGPVIVTRNGKPVAVLISVEDEEEIERLVLAYSPRFQSLLQMARKQIEEGGGIQHEEFWQEVEMGAETQRAE